MLFQPKMETIAWNDFFGKKTIKEEMPKLILITSATTYALSASQALAAGIQERIIHSFDPIVELMQGAAYPITLIAIMGGFLLLGMGKRPGGLAMIKWAAIGYIGIQFAPAIMQILVEVGKAIAGK